MLLGWITGVALGATQGQAAAPAMAPMRPWADGSRLEEEFEKRLEQAGDAAARVELALWCERHALFPQMEEVLESALEEAPDLEPARKLLRHARAADAWVPEELPRFAQEPAARQGSLVPLSASQQKELLRLKDQPMRVLGSSGVFDLRSDLPEEVSSLYHKAFSGYYRSLKSRFRVWVGSKVDVLIFSNRADYLRYYRDYVGSGGEHVLGFYSNKNLVLYDDPEDRAAVMLTARHECTHLILDLFYEGAAVPRWLHEGMACWFAAECEQALGTYTAELFDTVREQLAAGKPTPFEEVLRRPTEKFAFQDYAIAWSWIHFLNSGRHEERFQDFLAAVKQIPRSREEWGEEESPDAFTKRVTDSFQRQFEVKSLESDWRRYFLEEFALTSPQQALDHARYLVREKNVNSVEERARAAEEALRTLDGLPEKREPEIAAAGEELRLEAMLSRVAATACRPSALRLALRAFLDRLARLPGGGGELARAKLASEALEIARWKLLEKQPAPPIDLRAMLLAECARAPAEEAETLRSIVVSCDELVETARRSAAAVLAADALSRAAAFTWLHLATDAAPDGLSEIYPRLKHLLEVEPDDRNLAAMALCHLALGDSKWGRHLWEAAKQRSLHAASLRRFAPYFEAR
jgi:hypothetical protein